MTPIESSAVQLSRAHEPLPIAVDLDGTVTSADTLYEGFIDCLKRPVRTLPRLWRALRGGKAPFKREVAQFAELDPKLLPYNRGLIEYLQREKNAGRRLGLFTGAHQSVADRVADHLRIFDVAFGSDARTNLTGRAKAAAIRRAFGERFVYAGNAAVDQPIFAEAEQVILVGPVALLHHGLPPGKPVEAQFPARSGTLKTWIRALRLRHWVKNSLVFVAPVLGIHAVTLAVVFKSSLLFLAMGLLASATYILNDMFDLAADRRHPIKRLRPFAAGDLSIGAGLGGAALLFVATVILALFLPLSASALLAGYLIMTSSYSLVFKQVAMVDVLLLAGLFTIRVGAGGTLLATPVSPWLLTFSMLFFLGLAVIKRYAELERVMRTDSNNGRARGYSGRDLPILLATGVSSGISAVVIFTIYLINEQYPKHIYAMPGALWGIMPILLFWTLRAWHLGVHGRMNEDPVAFAIRDRVSLALGTLVLLLLFVAWI